MGGERKLAGQSEMARNRRRRATPRQNGKPV